MKSHYRISDFAKEFNVTARTIRHYEDEGLLSPQREGQNRLFSARDRARLKLALRATRVGFSLAQIRELFERYDSSENESAHLHDFLSLLDAHRSQLEQKRQDIEIMLNEFKFFADECQRRLHRVAGREHDTAQSP